MPEKSADVYYASLEHDRKQALETLRSLILQIAPEIKETMRYNMPTFELDEVVVAMASQKHYMSLYLDVELVAKYKDELSHLNCGKSCVRFKRISDLPLDTITQIITETRQKQKR
jgi:uncharacterized protein YdhG (YjbR/CyaY superfamily)